MIIESWYVMKKKDLILFSVLFILLFFAILYVIFSNYDFNTIYSNIISIDFKYIIICLVLVFMYFLCQGFYTKYIFDVLDESISLTKGIYYSIVEFLFNAITPGATCGQPMQLFYMSKDKIPMTKSLIVVILNTIIFKLFLVVGAILIFIFRSDYIFDGGSLVTILFWLGIVIDVVLIFAYFMLMFNQKLIRKILNIFYKVKKMILKNSVIDENKINDILDKYVGEAVFLKEHHKELFVSVLVTFIQRICMFSITYVIYKGFGFNGLSYFDLLLLQIFVQITIEGVLLPGGMGASEYVTNNMYLVIFGSLGLSGMILNRTLAFYIPIFIIVFIVAFVTKFNYFRDK